MANVTGRCRKYEGSPTFSKAERNISFLDILPSLYEFQSMVFAAMPERKAVVKAVALQSLRLPRRMRGRDMAATILDQPLASITAVSKRVPAITAMSLKSGKKTRDHRKGRLKWVSFNSRTSRKMARRTQKVVLSLCLILFPDRFMAEV